MLLGFSEERGADFARDFEAGPPDVAPGDAVVDTGPCPLEIPVAVFLLPLGVFCEVDPTFPVVVGALGLKVPLPLFPIPVLPKVDFAPLFTGFDATGVFVSLLAGGLLVSLLAGGLFLVLPDRNADPEVGEPLLEGRLREGRLIFVPWSETDLPGDFLFDDGGETRFVAGTLLGVSQ